MINTYLIIYKDFSVSYESPLNFLLFEIEFNNLELKMMRNYLALDENIIS